MTLPTVPPEEHVALFADTQAHLYAVAAERTGDPDDRARWRSVEREYRILARKLRRLSRRRTRKGIT